MPKSIGFDANLPDHITGNVTSLASLVLVQRPDSTEYRFTDHDVDIVISGWAGSDAIFNGTYSANNSYTRTNVKTSSGTGTDDLDVVGLLDSTAITAQDLRFSRFDGSTIYFLQINWKRPQDGPVRLKRAFLHEMQIRTDTYVFQLVGMMDVLKNQTIEIYAPTCRADFGDSRCKAQLEPSAWVNNTAYTANAQDLGVADVVIPTAGATHYYYRCTTSGTSGLNPGDEPTWPTSIGGTVNDNGVIWEAIWAYKRSGAVVTPQDENPFTVNNTLIIHPVGYFDGGVITWTSGENIGLSQEIQSWTLKITIFNEILLTIPMPGTVQAGDTFDLFAGCQKRFSEDCTTTHGNNLNFRGEPFVPGDDIMFRPAPVVDQ